jgi:DNA polymerase III delta prime subunit
MMRRTSRSTWLILVVGTISALFLLLLDLLKGALASKFPSLPLWIIVMSIVVVIVLATAIGLWYERLKSTPDTSAATARENRQFILSQVQNNRVADILENLLYYSYDEQLLPLSLRVRVGSRYDLVLSDPLEPAQTMPSGTTITQVFDQAGGELLILGEAGAGKTTKLLELARDLFEQAQGNESASIPVVLMLSSWATKKLPLEKWVVEELKAKYDIPSQIGKAWTKGKQLLLLLDGLDEVGPGALTECIEAINEYYRKLHRSLVVCSRREEYLNQLGRLALHTAVTVQPLASEQVDAYFDSLTAKGEDVEGLKQALSLSKDLRTLATTPLFLTVLIHAYHGKPAQELLALGKAASTKEQRHVLFHDYVERMLQREGTHIHAPIQQTKRWLAWLARQMIVDKQSELYLEQFQPDWLPKRQRAFYQWNIVLVVVLVVGLVDGLVDGLLFGLRIGLVDAQPRVLVAGIGIGLFFGLKTKIKPMETLIWSWKELVSLLVVGLVGGLVVGLVVGIRIGLVVGLVVGLVFELLSELLFGFFKRSVLSPNERIRRSIKNGLVFGLVGGSAFGLFGGSAFGSVFGLFGGSAFGLFGELLFGLRVGLFFGLGAAIQHYTLRFWLWRAGYTPTPWQYVAFLDDTVEQLFLRKVGGGYIFRYPLLQDYFASLEVILPQDFSFHAETRSVLQNASNDDPSA